MQVLPIRFDEVQVGDHLLQEYRSFERAGSEPTTRLYVGDERVACRGFHVVEVVEVALAGDDVIVTSTDGEVSSSIGNQILRVTL